MEFSFFTVPSFLNNQRDTNTSTSDDEFFAFHNVDRLLFARLVFNLRFEPLRAMHAVAFWLWLERLNMAQYVSSLVKFPESVLRVVLEETVVCLKVVESDTFNEADSVGVPMLQRILGRKDNNKEGVELIRYFHKNRISILLGIAHFVDHVCVRAFQHLIQTALACNSNVGFHANVGVGGFAPRPPSSPCEVNFGDAVGGDQFNEGDYTTPLNYVPLLPVNNNTNSVSETQPQALQGDLVDHIFEQLGLTEGSHNTQHYFKEKPNPIPVEERTVFLTFSKGSPIPKNELRKFFTRSFGDIIETLNIQEVGEKEQPLYARLVVRDAKAMEIVLTDGGKSKFSINGKDVWARKYVRKNPQSPPLSPPNYKAN